MISHYTSTIYGLIKNEEYDEAIKELEFELQNFPTSRAALSLLGYCYYHSQHYGQSASIYERLSDLNPHVHEYKLYFVQSLFRAGSYQEARRVASRMLSSLNKKNAAGVNSTMMDGDLRPKTARPKTASFAAASSSFAKNTLAEYQLRQELTMLLVSIKYEEQDFSSCKSLLDKNCLPDDPNTIIALAALDYQDGDFEEALNKYLDVSEILGYRPDISYHIALCHYKLNEFKKALSIIDDMVDRGVQEYPELFIGNHHSSDVIHANGDIVSPSQSDDDDMTAFSGQLNEESFSGLQNKSFTSNSSQQQENQPSTPVAVKNLTLLHESQLIEAFNLKAAIEYQRNNNKKQAKYILTKQIPYREEDDIDPVTLHNQALLVDMAEAGTSEGGGVTSALQKLSFLLSNPPFPPETFGNILLLYCQYGCYDMAADILAENSDLTFTFLTQELFEYLDALIMTATNPEEAYQKLDTLSQNYITKLRGLIKDISDANNAVDQTSKSKESIRKSVEKFNSVQKQYIPVLMAQAKIFWEKENYEMVERLFRQSAEFCGDNETWKLNVGHVFFMQQGSKFKDAISYYDPLVRKACNNNGKGKILDVPAIVLANLCVAYIMTNQNEAAEEIMKLIETEEEEDLLLPSKTKNHKKMFHSCIVNLVIGTLYCEKGNFEFGISRVCKSLEPYKKKLGTDTWFYTKRCLLALAENISKHLICISNDTLKDVILFLVQVEKYGGNIPANSSDDDSPHLGESSNQVQEGDGVEDSIQNTVAAEARQLRQLFIKFSE